MEEVVEIWKPVVGYEGLYEVSNLGRLKKLKGWRCKKDAIKKGSLNKCGYRQFYLSKKGQKKCRQLIHRMVIGSFKGPSDLTVNHINEDKSDNRLSNLEYVTLGDNIRKYHDGRRCLPVGVARYNKKDRFIARIHKYKNQYTLGIFDTPEEASEAYQKALAEYKKEQER